SGSEGPVRAAIARELPAWARSETDTAGNLLVRAGSGEPLVVFVAHMDEIGFTVTAVREDGTLELSRQGGFYPSLYEGRPALVHVGASTVPGVFVPRDSVGPDTHRTPPVLRVDVGASSRAAAESLGVTAGATVTMPKEYAPLAGTRATGRSMDDRVGCTALLLALRHLDRSKLRHAVLFVFSVREEIGLEGAQAVAHELGLHAARVHAIDTFVSADAPLDPKTFALAPVGAGPVARALDGSSATPPADVDSLVALARRSGIPLQVGTTGGGNDGSVFAEFGVPDVPIGWPLRYSHSPAEVVDLRDVRSLGAIVRAVAEGW
ncbi:MAG TPA: M20/M25/M40 family metallo-hydrolase, partial [Candidatus Limnocylindrales bacterium]|nr:M20/M25/M40 family metallo-hydrolase [Candidatus Limnocylindrales bacterium]